MKVLFVTHTAQLGGAEIMLELMATGLAGRGHTVSVAVGSDGPLVERLRSGGVPVRRLVLGKVSEATRRRVRPSASLIGDFGRAVWSVRSLIRELGIEVCVSNTAKAHLIASLARTAVGVPVAWRLHDIVSPENFGRAHITALRFAGMMSGARVLAVSAAVESAARQTLRLGNITHIPNGVDPARVVPREQLGLRRRFDWPPDAVVFGMIGRVVRWKGALELVEAAHMASDRAPNARYLIVGDELIDVETGYRDEVLARIAALGLTGTVEMLPFTDDVGSVLAELDVVVQASLEPEPFGLAVAEAALAGVPVIAFNHGGLTEIIKDEVHGRLVPPRSVTALAQACGELAADGARREAMGRAIKQDSAWLTADRMCARLADELMALAGRR